MNQVGAITSYIDVAQLVLYAFWIFFAGLIWYLHRENKREGYPLETPDGRGLKHGFPMTPPSKTFRLADGTSMTVPRPPSTGTPQGPGAWAERRDIPDVTVTGTARIVPLRADPTFSVAVQDVDPRGLPVVGGDGRTGGTVREMWVDRSEVLFRYLEVEAEGGARVLLPVNVARIGKRAVVVDAIFGRDFAGVPTTRDPDTVTLLEEERIQAYSGAGTLYASPERSEPLF
jgi:photosynthetic reaction center H subunit